MVFNVGSKPQPAPIDVAAQLRGRRQALVGGRA
jgi:hypothetical protein